MLETFTIRMTAIFEHFIDIHNFPLKCINNALSIHIQL